MRKYIIQSKIGNAWYDDEQEQKFDSLRNAIARLITLRGEPRRFRLIARTEEILDV